MGGQKVIKQTQNSVHSLHYSLFKTYKNIKSIIKHIETNTNLSTAIKILEPAQLTDRVLTVRMQQDRTGQVRTGPDRTGQDRRGRSWT